jgi:hypothetical protein
MMEAKDNSIELVVKRMREAGLDPAAELTKGLDTTSQCIYVPDQMEQKITKSHLMDLTILIEAAANGNIEATVIEEWVKSKITSKDRKGNAWEELERMQVGIRNLYDIVIGSIIETKAKISDDFDDMPDMNQPKYKVSSAAIILKVERATLNNWTNNRGDYIKSFRNGGTAKYILESDLKQKYKEITGNDLVIDDTLRSKYEYTAKV